MEKQIVEKRCELCGKAYDHEYELFGRGCLDNLYILLGLKKPGRYMKNKEMYLCNCTAWMYFKFFLSKKKKQRLTEKHIALKFLDKMDLDFLDDIKKQIKEDISKITIFSKNVVENISFKLNEVYELFNLYEKFTELMDELKKVDWEEIDQKLAEEFLERISFVFDVTKIVNPISYVAFYAMQYKFWQIVIVGGVLVDFKLSARLLNNSLALFGKEPKDLTINDEETINKIKDSSEFKEKIKFLINKYYKDGEKISGDSKSNNDFHLVFNSNDLLYALHGVTTQIDIEKSSNVGWNIKVVINDTYDYTDFNSLKDYVDTNGSVATKIFSTTLNNLGVISMDYGVIKEYQVTIEFELIDYIVEE